MKEQRRPILYKGESYFAPVNKKNSGPPKIPKVSFEEAKVNIIKDINTTTAELKSLQDIYKMPNEFVVCMRLNPDFSAKSYYPATLFGDNEEDLQEIGSRIWRKTEEEDSGSKESIGKLLFIKTTDAGLSNFTSKLNAFQHTKQFELDVRKIDAINLLLPFEQVLGFASDWEEGKIEAVIHPLGKDRTLAVERFIELSTEAGVDINAMKFKQYENGVTFISLKANKDIIAKLSGYNPLRTIHPLVIRQLPDVSRMATINGVPNAPDFKSKSNIILGVVDGGYKKGNSYLDKYVETIDSVNEPSFDGGEIHGTLVTSTALYGPINSFSNTDKLKEPAITVRNFRVLSTLNGSDPELYSAIDALETIVTQNKDISVYNLSFGPQGGITDDYINRFTYSCDLMSYNEGVLFCVAVGNDGEHDGYNRIQSPSDIVNGIGVGAYSIIDGNKVRASYSCIGPGREGNKLKPDILSFGGCERYPTQLISHTAGNRTYTCGTSFASPIVAATAAQLIGGSNNEIDGLVARALLVHSASERQSNSHSIENGHGTLPDNVEDIVNCPNKSLTLIYQGELPPAKYLEYTIPWIEGLLQTGKVNFKWTTAVLTNIDPLSPDDYTTSSIQTTFYPNSKKFSFSKLNDDTKKMQKIVVDIESDGQLAEQLINDGWKKNEFPVSESGPIPFETEQELRTDMKWDSLDYREKTKMAKSIKKPMFHIHAINRGKRNDTDKIKFALILTIDTPKAEIDLYSKIRMNYPALLPLNVNIETQVQIKA